MRYNGDKVSCTCVEFPVLSTKTIAGASPFVNRIFGDSSAERGQQYEDDWRKNPRFAVEPWPDAG